MLVDSFQQRNKYYTIKLKVTSKKNLHLSKDSLFVEEERKFTISISCAAQKPANLKVKRFN